MVDGLHVTLTNFPFIKGERKGPFLIPLVPDQGWLNIKNSIVIVRVSLSSTLLLLSSLSSSSLLPLSPYFT